jgi:hypothetical protein
MAQHVVLGLFAGPFVAVLVLVLTIWHEHRSWTQAMEIEVARRTSLEARFSQIVDADAEAARIVADAESTAQQRKVAAQQALETLAAQTHVTMRKLEEIGRSYAETKARYTRLAKEVAAFDERLAFAEMGVYEPHFDFDTSEEFKNAIAEVRDRQKAMVSNNTWVISRAWIIGGRATKGKTKSSAVLLTLRAFNSECDAAIANVRWNNVKALEKRIENARKFINRQNVPNAIEITERYFALKLEELRLTHEYREKLKQENEEQLASTRSAREEQKLLHDMELAEQEEARYQRMLSKAQAEAKGAVGFKLDAYTQHIGTLERDLVDARTKIERARAMVEMTKSGYVYIISNTGSFGPELVKIGVTRRLDPTDLVRELGGASVPFFFDIHAIIYSEEATALKQALHQEFATQRVNKSNFRKEFFRAPLHQVEAAVRRLAPRASFFNDIEAQEYRETIAQESSTVLEPS